MNPNSMTPVDWAKVPILEKYADFSGRASRPEFWWYTLALIVAFIVVGIVDSILGLSHMIFYTWGPLTLLLRLATIVPSLAVATRRLHDTNRPGWWVLLPLIPECLMMVMAATTVGAIAAGGGVGAAVGGAMLTGLIGLIALAGAIVLIVFCALPGQPVENRYGPPPVAGDGTTVAAE
jgi:uncharacterized membrane protein YhaH (DUF805 family)